MVGMVGQRVRKLMSDEDYIRTMSVVNNEGCWIWRGSRLPCGYGLTSRKRLASKRAHCAAFAVFVGPLVKGLTIDHECHNASTDCAGGDTCRHRACVNPEHLAQKSIRANAAASRNWSGNRTHCPIGHELSGKNRMVRRPTVAQSIKTECRACHYERVADRRARRLADGLCDRCDERRVNGTTCERHRILGAERARQLRSINAG